MLVGQIKHPDMPRPPRPDAGDSWDWTVEVDKDWGPAIPGRQCRWTHLGERCPNRGVASLYRPAFSTKADRRPWAYCADHLYGRWIEAGNVVQWQWNNRRVGGVTFNGR